MLGKVDAPVLEARKRAFLDALASGQSIRGACETADCSTTAPYVWDQQDPEFAAAFRVLRRGLIGYHEAQLERLGQGDGMPAFMSNIARLRAEAPDRYVDRHIVVKSAGGELEAAVQEFMEALKAHRAARQLQPPEEPSPP